MVEAGYKEVRVGPRKVKLPVNWKTSKIKELLKIKSGYAFKSDDYVEDGIFMVRVTNINDSGEIKKGNGETKYLPEEYLEEYKKYRLEDKDILLVMVGASTGKIGKVNNDVLPAILNQNMWNLKPKRDNLDKSYFYYSILKEINRFLSMKIGSARSYIKKGDFKKFEIPLPTLPEQKKIASILTSVDNSIEKTDEVIEETKELKKGLMQELLTKGIGHSNFKEVRIGVKEYEIPHKWKVKKLEECCEINYGKDQSDVEDENGEYPILGTGGLIGYAKDYLYDKPSVLIGRKGTIDEPQYMEVPFWTIDTLFYTSDFKETYSKWLYYYLNYYDLSLLNEATGVPSLNRNNLYNLDLPYPPLEEQKKIASILSSVDEKIKKEEEYKAKLERLKKGLMQKLLTGEIRVNTDMEV